VVWDVLVDHVLAKEFEALADGCGPLEAFAASQDARLECLRPRLEPAGNEQMHPFSENARRHPEGSDLFKGCRPIAGLLGQFPGRGFLKRLDPIKRTSRNFEQAAADRPPKDLN
jgi:hypothetical protein